MGSLIISLACLPYVSLYWLPCFETMRLIDMKFSMYVIWETHKLVGWEQQ